MRRPRRQARGSRNGRAAGPRPSLHSHDRPHQTGVPPARKALLFREGPLGLTWSSASISRYPSDCRQAAAGRTRTVTWQLALGARRRRRDRANRLRSIGSSRWAPPARGSPRGQDPSGIETGRLPRATPAILAGHCRSRRQSPPRWCSDRRSRFAMAFRRAPLPAPGGISRTGWRAGAADRRREPAAATPECCPPRTARAPQERSIS